MYAMGPEFFNFIKKLEENGDKLASSTPLEQPVDFEFNNSTCHVCNGYYGPSFGEPVCGTCHSFLFPDFPSYLPSSYFCSEKTDDGDSGNDEPSDLNFSSERKVNRTCPLPAWWYYRSSLDSETSPEDEASRASNSGAGASSSGNGGSCSNSGGAGSGAGSAAGSSLSVAASSGGIGSSVGGSGRGSSTVTGNGSATNVAGGCSRGVSSTAGSGGPISNSGGPSRGASGGPSGGGPSNNSGAAGWGASSSSGGPSNNSGGPGRSAGSGPSSGGPSNNSGAAGWGASSGSGGPSNTSGGPGRSVCSGPSSGGPSNTSGGPGRSVCSGPSSGGPSNNPGAAGWGASSGSGGPSNTSGGPGRSVSSGSSSGGPSNNSGGASRGAGSGPSSNGPSNNSGGVGRDTNGGSGSGEAGSGGSGQGIGNGSGAGGPSRLPATAAGNGGSSHESGNGTAGSSASAGGAEANAPGENSRPDAAAEERAGLGPPPPTPSLARSLQALSTPRLPDNLAPGLVEQLPSEVLLCIFSYLDDLSLCACACVCARWWRLVRARVVPPRWAAFTARRFPLYRPLLANIDWHKKYQSLVESCFCRNCLVQMCIQAQPAGEENAWRRNRLRIELKMLRNDPPEGIAATPLDAKCCHWQASVTGPVGSPYEGGVFYLYIQVPYAYPMSPPVVRFLTRILHPNISRHGDVGIDSVHHNWSLALTISKVLISIQSLLTDPYTAVCMEPELGEMYVRDRQRFEALARNWTWRYAMHDIMPH